MASIHSSVRMIAATILLSWCDHIPAQDSATSEFLVRLKSGNVQDIALAISSLPDGSMDSPEISRQLTLLLNDERAVVEHLLGRETVAERAWFKLVELPSAASIPIMQMLPALETDRARGKAFEAISRIGQPNPRAYEMILPYCGEKDVDLRSRAISALSTVVHSNPFGAGKRILCRRSRFSGVTLPFDDGRRRRTGGRNRD